MMTIPSWQGSSSPVALLKKSISSSFEALLRCFSAARRNLVSINPQPRAGHGPRQKNTSLWGNLSWWIEKMLRCRCHGSNITQSRSLLSIFLSLLWHPITLMGRRNSAGKSSVQHGFSVQHSSQCQALSCLLSNHVQIYSACATTLESAREPSDFHNFHQCPTSLLPTHTVLPQCQAAVGNDLLACSNVKWTHQAAVHRSCWSSAPNPSASQALLGTCGKLKTSPRAFACSIQAGTNWEATISFMCQVQGTIRSKQPSTGGPSWVASTPKNTLVPSSSTWSWGGWSLLCWTFSSTAIRSPKGPDWNSIFIHVILQKNHRCIHSALDGAEAIPTAHSPPIPSLSLQMMDIFLGSNSDSFRTYGYSAWLRCDWHGTNCFISNDGPCSHATEHTSHCNCIWTAVKVLRTNTSSVCRSSNSPIQTSHKQSRQHTIIQNHSTSTSTPYFFHISTFSKAPSSSFRPSYTVATSSAGATDAACCEARAREKLRSPSPT